MNEQRGHIFEREVLGREAPTSSLSWRQKQSLQYKGFGQALDESVASKPAGWNEFVPTSVVGRNLYSKVFFYLTWYDLEVVSKMSHEERRRLPRSHDGLLAVSEVYEKLGFYPAAAVADYYHGFDCFFQFTTCDVYLTIDVTMKNRKKKGVKAQILLRKRDTKDNWLLTKISANIAKHLCGEYLARKRKRAI